MSKPATNEQGVPVRRGAYDYETKRGKLQDVNQDNQVSFADTWLGDLLGSDGQGGVQGPGMRDSMAGARRRAIETMQAQGVPMTQANLARAMNPPGRQGGEAAAQPAAAGTGGGGADSGQAAATEDGGGSGLETAAGVAAAGASGAAVARLYNGKPLAPDAKGMVALPTARGGGSMNMVPYQDAVDQGWAVVGINYPDGSNALPSPSAVDMIDGKATDVTAPATPRYADGDPRNSAGAVPAASAGGDPATRPIATEEIIEVPPNKYPQLTDEGNASGVHSTIGLSETGTFVDGAPIMRDMLTGQYRVTDMNGNVHTGGTPDEVYQLARNAVRAALR